MIHRVVEYVISCDALRLVGKECSLVGGTAYNSGSKLECMDSARRDGWVQVTARFWLCKQCDSERKAKQ